MSEAQTDPPADPPANPPDVSIVVPTVGRPTIERCVASVLTSGSATTASVEIVVVWQSTLPPPDLPDGVRIVPAFPAGVAYARNKGIAEAGGALVAFIDDDEVADVGWIAAIVHGFAERITTDAMFGTVAPWDEEGIPYCHYTGTERRVFTKRSTPPWVVGTEGNMAFRRQALCDVGAFDLTFGIGAPGASAEGADLIVRLLGADLIIEFVPDMVVFHPSKTVEERLASRFPYGYGMGKVVRRHRDALLATKYAVAGLQNLGRSIRNRDRRRTVEAARTLRGFTSGALRRSAWDAPMAHLRLTPAAISAAVDGAEIVAVTTQYRARPHFVYRVGGDRVLHVYASPADEVVVGHRDRARIRAEATVGGIPRALAVEATDDALWVVEDLVPGRPPAPDTSTWFAPAVAWAQELAEASGPSLDALDGWSARRDAIVGSLPPAFVGSVSSALDDIGELPSVPVHGDYERKNVHVHDGGLGVVDWETAEWRGLPGQDLLFLTATALRDRPDAVVLADLVRGREPSFGSVLPALEAIGVPADRLPALLLVVLARWRAQERARMAMPGTRPTARDYDALFRRLAPVLGVAT